jgi:hypothetical protein
LEIVNESSNQFTFTGSTRCTTSTAARGEARAGTWTANGDAGLGHEEREARRPHKGTDQQKNERETIAFKGRALAFKEGFEVKIFFEALLPSNTR